MITKEEIVKTLAKDKPQLQKQFKVRKLALFGSYARGDQRQDSDVTLAERLEETLKTSVDLISSRAVTSQAFKFIEPELIYA